MAGWSKNSLSGNRHYKFAGRPKIRWENDIKEDIRNKKKNNWRECDQDRVKWKEVVEKAETFKGCNCSA